MDRNRNESRIHRDSKEKNSTTKHVRSITTELAYVWITADGIKFTDKEKAMAHQNELYEQAIGNNIEVKVKPTIEQIKEKVYNFLKNGNTDDVTEWILDSIDCINSMNHAMSEWNDTKFRDEYENLTKWGLIDED